MIELYVLRAFASTDKPGSGGVCGVIFDPTTRLSEVDRQQIASNRRLPEIVYVDDLENAAVQVFTPSRQRAYAGYPLIAAAWLLCRQGYRVHAMCPPAGSVPARVDAHGAFLSLPLAWVHPYEFQEVKDPAALCGEIMHGRTTRSDISNHDRVVLWAWSDPTARKVVMKSTIPDHPYGQGISASIALALGAAVGTPLLVEQGDFSICTVVSGNDGVLEVGGYVTLDGLERLDN